jgi:3-dehydrotetronate 4-kinase
MLLGCIADDLTGATDLALMLTREGMRTLLCTGLPPEGLDVAAADAVVVALKSRTIAAADAVAQSRAAAAALRRCGAQRLFFKYCSTFDSTDAGNIGPVTAALLEEAGGVTIACPAFPATGRTLYAGYLFVNGVPLNESPMKDHPLTPMHDANLVRVLQRQTALPVGLVAFDTVAKGAAAIRAAIAQGAASHRIFIVDALSDDHLRAIGAAVAHLPLITGGSGVAMGLPVAYRDAGLLAGLTPAPQTLRAPPGRAAILAGSCSAATRAQVKAAIAAGLPHWRVDPLEVASGSQTARGILTWIDRQPTDRPFLVYSSDDPDAVREAQHRLGRAQAGTIVEDTLGAIAAALPARGITRLIVAGGETSGAVMQALGAGVLTIGPEIAPGVPWTLLRSGERSGAGLALALKSGNFGAEDFFLSAWDRLA